MPNAELQYLDPSKVRIEGHTCAGMTIRAPQGNILGEVNGFLIDPIGRRLRYLVVKTLKHTRILPFAMGARVNTARNEIEVTSDERDFRRARDVFPALSMLGSS
jgi:hypothetical protein